MIREYLALGFYSVEHSGSEQTSCSFFPNVRGAGLGIPVPPSPEMCEF